MKAFLKKLSSRKLWLAIAGVATGIAVALGVDAGDLSTVTGAVTAVISVVVYIVTEGKIDAESVKNAIVDVQDVIGTFETLDHEEGAEK